MTNFNCELPLPGSSIDTLACYCSDGRFADQMSQFLSEGLGIDYCDRMVVPGGPGVLARHDETIAQAEAVAEQMGFLITAHEIKRVVLIFHEDCGYYKGCVHVGNDMMTERQLGDKPGVVDQVKAMGDGLAVECYMAKISGDGIEVVGF